MCGIVGYIGNQNSAEILIDGLKKLEYRGYDSAGIAVFDHNNVKVVKSKGRIASLEQKLAVDKVDGCCGIGHTRWATHGEPSDINSHPHRVGRVTLVHNGIIENYSELREQLKSAGRVFVSETDTEVAAHLIDSYYDGDPIDAIFTAISHIRGSYAFGILFDDYPDKLFALRKDSPLIVGVGENENFIASDIPAILSRTNEYYLLEENELAVLTSEGVNIIGKDRGTIKKDLFKANWDISAAEKGGYDHFMLKEINEQPKALADTISPRIKNGAPGIFSQELPDVSEIKRMYVVACGSACHAGMVGKHIIEDIAGIPVITELASEFRYSKLFLEKGDVVVLISQSGETADTLAALRIAKSMGIPTIAIVNVVGSTIAREADTVLYTWAGPEIAVATTKAYVCQVAVMLLLALRFAAERGTISADEQQRLISLLEDLPEVVRREIKNAELYKEIAECYSDHEDIFFIGRGYDSALCWEASIKLKEISYIHSEAYAAGELKHGTLSLIDKGTPVIAIATCDRLFEKTISNVKETKARGASVILVCKKGAAVDKTVYDHIIEIEPVDEFIRPVASIIPLQIFAYYTACARGCDVDKPRNLAKSVTVE